MQQPDLLQTITRAFYPLENISHLIYEASTAIRKTKGKKILNKKLAMRGFCTQAEYENLKIQDRATENIHQLVSKEIDWKMFQLIKRRTAEMATGLPQEQKLA